jgi:hypothetical protein
MPPESAGFTHIYRPSTPAEADSMVQELVPLHPDVIKMWVDDAVWKDGSKVSDGPLTHH